MHSASPGFCPLPEERTNGGEMMMQHIWQKKTTGFMKYFYDGYSSPNEPRSYRKGRGIIHDIRYCPGTAKLGN
jgi:hypothetical protein